MELFIRNFRNNPAFSLALGLLPLIMVTTTLESSLWYILIFVVIYFIGISLAPVFRVSINTRMISYVIILFISILSIVFLLLLGMINPLLKESLGIYFLLLCTNNLLVGMLSGYIKTDVTEKHFLSNLGSICSYSFIMIIISLFREIISLGTITIVTFGSNFSLKLNLGIPILFPLFATHAGGFIMAGLLAALFRVCFQYNKVKNV